jgi:hypothetical protein
VSSSHTFHDGVFHDSVSLAAIMSLRPIGNLPRSLASSHTARSTVQLRR